MGGSLSRNSDNENGGGSSGGSGGGSGSGSFAACKRKKQIIYGVIGILILLIIFTFVLKIVKGTVSVFK